MGRLDIAEKVLADYNDVFADIVNVLLFHGKQVVSENYLQNTKDKSMYKADDSEIHEQERDLSKVVTDKNIKIALVGLENQTKVDEYEPLRCIGYDGASYRSQLLPEDKEVYPVITLVLYFGLSRWNKSKSLYERLTISDEWKPFVNDYKINLFEIAFLSPEQVQIFKSDFRIIADYFVQKRINKDYIPSKETIDHVDEVLKLMSVLTKDNRFQKVQGSTQGKEVQNMCDVLDRVEEKGLAKGKAEGIIEGKVMAFYEAGLSISEIMDKVSLSNEEVCDILKKNKLL